MKEESIYKSYIGNLINSLAGMLMPLITIPYILRRLGPEVYGEFNFAANIISYFTMVLLLGLPLFGMREIAKYKEDKRTISEIFVKIQLFVFLNLIFVTVVYFLIVYTTSLKENLFLYQIFYFQILFTTFNIDWFFNGIQKYTINAKVTIINKLAFTLLILLFIKDKGDIFIYAGITATCLLIQDISYILVIRKYVDISFACFSGIITFFQGKIKSILFLFLSILSTQLYANIAILMLGIIKGDTEIGYYTAANKIARVVVTVAMVTGPIMLTKLSSDINKKKDVTGILKKSLSFNYLVSIPATVGGILIANDLIRVVCGIEFIPSTNTFRVLMLLPIIISSTYFITAQVLIPLGKDKLFAILTLLTTVANIILNLFLIPRFGAIGAAITAIISELFLLFISFRYIPQNVKAIFKLNHLIDYAVGSALFGGVILLVNHFVGILYLRLILNVLLSGIIYVSYLFLIKNKLIRELFAIITGVISRKRVKR